MISLRMREIYVIKKESTTNVITTGKIRYYIRLNTFQTEVRNKEIPLKMTIPCPTL